MSHCIGYAAQRRLPLSPVGPPLSSQSSQSVSDHPGSSCQPASLLITRPCQSRRTNYLIVALGCSAPSLLRIFNYDSVCEPFEQSPFPCTLPTYRQTSAFTPPPPDALHCLEPTSWHRSTCPLTAPPSRVATRGSSTASYPSQTPQPTPNGPCSRSKLPCSMPSKMAGPRRAFSRSRPKEVSFIPPPPLPENAVRRHPADKRFRSSRG